LSPPLPAGSRPTRLGAVLLAAVVTVTVLAFLPVLDAGFLNWDDDANLVDNPRYRGLGPEQLRWMFTTLLLGHYIPLTWLSLGVNYALGGMDPWGYHLGNLLLHAAGAGVFFLVARRLLAAAFAGGVMRPSAGAPRESDLAIGAAFAALVFGVHPLRVESVAWVTERRDVLCGLFYLLAALAYLRGVAGGGPIERRWWALSIGAFGLALGSKAAAMPLPAALLLIDVYPLRRVVTVGWRRILLEKAPYLLLGVAAAVVALIAQRGARAVTGYEQYGVGARVGMTAYSLVFYPSKLLWAANLSPLYELPSRVDPLAPRFLVAEIGLVAVTVALVALRRRLPAALAAWVYSAFLVLPVTGAVVHAGLQLVSDRYSYLSGLGFALLAGGGLTWLLGERRRLKPSVVGATLLVAALIVLGWAAGTWRQSKIWRDSETLWRRAQTLDPDCAVCSINLGATLVFAPRTDQGRVREAEGLFRHAIALRPDRAFAYHGLGVALALQRRYEEAESAFREYIGREPAAATGPADLGLLRLAQHRYAEAIPYLRRAIALEPRFQSLGTDLARALRERSAELRTEGKVSEADALVREAEGLPGRPSGAAAPDRQRSVTTTAR
jgi:tetratricopeptide (TPR) repeat protein